MVREGSLGKASLGDKRILDRRICRGKLFPLVKQYPKQARNRRVDRSIRGWRGADQSHSPISGGRDGVFLLFSGTIGIGCGLPTYDHPGEIVGEITGVSGVVEPSDVDSSL